MGWFFPISGTWKSQSMWESFGRNAELESWKLDAGSQKPRFLKKKWESWKFKAL